METKKWTTTWTPVIEMGPTYWQTDDGIKTVEEMTDEELAKCAESLGLLERKKKLNDIFKSDKFKNLKSALEQIEKEHHGN